MNKILQNVIKWSIFIISIIGMYFSWLNYNSEESDVMKRHYILTGFILLLTVLYSINSISNNKLNITRFHNNKLGMTLE